MKTLKRFIIAMFFILVFFLIIGCKMNGLVILKTGESVSIINMVAIDSGNDINFYKRGYLVYKINKSEIQTYYLIPSKDVTHDY